MPAKKYYKDYYYHAITFDMKKIEWFEAEAYCAKHGFDPYTHYWIGHELIYVQTEGHLFDKNTIHKFKLENGIYIFVGKFIY